MENIDWSHYKGKYYKVTTKNHLHHHLRLIKTIFLIGKHLSNGDFSILAHLTVRKSSWHCTPPMPTECQVFAGGQAPHLNDGHSTDTQWIGGVEAARPLAKCFPYDPREFKQFTQFLIFYHTCHHAMTKYVQQVFLTKMIPQINVHKLCEESICSRPGLQGYCITFVCQLRGSSGSIDRTMSFLDVRSIGYLIGNWNISFMCTCNFSIPAPEMYSFKI